MLIRITIQIQEFLSEFLPLRDGISCKNVAGSTGLEEVCCLRVLPLVNVALITEHHAIYADW